MIHHQDPLVALIEREQVSVARTQKTAELNHRISRDIGKETNGDSY